MAASAQPFRTTVWSWLVPIIAAFLLYLLIWERRLGRLLPGGSALRIGVIAALGAGLLGFAVNDSGVIVTALVYLYLAPCLTLLALEAQRGGDGTGGAFVAPLGNRKQTTGVTQHRADGQGEHRALPVALATPLARIGR